jgi:hypothetical protein
MSNRSPICSLIQADKILIDFEPVHYDLLPLDVYNSTEYIEVALWLVSDYLSDDRHPSMAVSFSYKKNEYSTFKSYVDADEISAIESFLNTISGDEGAAILSKKTIDFISIRHASTEMHFTTRSGGCVKNFV